MHHPKIVWITGASSGIGAALARVYLDRGATVGVCGRNAEALAALCAGNPRARPYSFDILDAHAGDQAFADFVSEVGVPDLAILNAGTHKPTPMKRFSREDAAFILGTNLQGLFNTFEPVVATMMAHKQGQIAIVGSVAGYHGLPFAGVYSATKAAVARFTETAHMELKLYGIDVRLIAPGFVRTPLTDKNDFPMPFLMEAPAAAERIRKGLEGKGFEITFPKRLSWMLKLIAILPRWMSFGLMSGIIRKGS